MAQEREQKGEQNRGKMAAETEVMEEGKQTATAAAVRAERENTSFFKDPLQFPSLCEGSSSSVSMDNSRTSSFDLASSMGDINNSLGPEGRHTYDNTNEAIMSLKTNTARTEEHLTSTRNLKAAAPVGVGNGHIVVVDSSKEGNASDKAEKKKKGLLNFIYATADKMTPLSIAFSVFSLYCIFQEHGDITWMRIICGGSGISLFSSFFMIGFAAAFKEGESINHAGFVIFIWLLFLQLQVYNIGICAILCVFANIPIWFVCVVGTTGFCFTIWTWVIYLEEGKFLKEWGKVIFKFIFKFLKGVMRKKMECCPRGLTLSLAV